MILEVNSQVSRISFIKNFLLLREAEASVFDIRIFLDNLIQLSLTHTLHKSRKTNSYHSSTW